MKVRKYKFLIVEDEALIALLLERNLLKEGQMVCGTAASGRQAIELARREQPEVILMDIRLQGAMDGIAAAQQILEFLPAEIIFITGYLDRDLEARARSLNPAAFLNKPVALGQILAVLAERSIG